MNAISPTRLAEVLDVMIRRRTEDRFFSDLSASDLLAIVRSEFEQLSHQEQREFLNIVERSFLNPAGLDY